MVAVESTEPASPPAVQTGMELKMMAATVVVEEVEMKPKEKVLFGEVQVRVGLTAVRV